MFNLTEQDPTVVLHVNPSLRFSADELMRQVRARNVCEARAQLAAAKARLEAAEELFEAVASDEPVVLDDGTKVAVVKQQRRNIDAERLEAGVSSQQWTRLSKRVLDTKLFDLASAANQLDSQLVDAVTTYCDVSFVRVTQPKR